MPAKLIQQLPVALIAGNVVCAFGFPELSVCGGFDRAITAIVAVPEATVHEDDPIVSPEHQIGAAGEVSLMQSEAVSQTVNEAADEHLGAGVLRANAGHVAGPLFRRVYVGHAGGAP